VHKDARFSIETAGFLGDQFVAIRPMENKAPEFQPGDFAEAQKPFNIQEFLGSSGALIERLETTADKLNAVIGDVQHLVLDRETLTNVSVTMANARLLSGRMLTTVDNLNELVVSNRLAVSVSLSNFSAFSARLNEDATTLAGLLATNGPGIDRSIKNIETSTEILKAAMQDVQAGKGVAGALLKNDELATRISNIASNLSITSSNLNRVGLWGILWKPKPPKTPAAEPSPKPLTAPKFSAE
jgi:ABC-type transporter Mla subunit MlaD